LLADDRLGIPSKQHPVGQNAGAFAAALQAANDVQQVSVIALFGGRLAPDETLPGVGRREAGAPSLVRERRIGDHVIVSPQAFAILELGRGQRIARQDVGGGKIMQDHIHAGETGSGHVLFLPFQGDALTRLGGDFEQQRTRTASRIVGGGRCLGIGGRDANHFGNDAADLGRRVELALALTRILGEMPHQILVGIAQNVVVFGAILGKIQFRLLKDGDEVGQALYHRLTLAQFVGVVEVGEIALRQAGIGIHQGGDDLGVDLVADAGLALERHHVLETRARRNRHRRSEIVAVAVLVADVLDEQHEQHVILVLAGVHTPAGWRPYPRAVRRRKPRGRSRGQIF